MATVLGASVIDCTTTVRIGNVVFRSSGAIDDSFYKTLFLIDGKRLTNHGRQLSSEISQIFIQNSNWNATKSRYYKRVTASGRNIFNLTWSFLPNSKNNTVDFGYARDFLKEISSDPDVHILTILNDDSSGITPYTSTSYNVFISNYSETLVRRDISNNIYLWECNLTLEEA